jgi:hypothetical protein
MWEQINALLAQASDRVMSGIANFLPGLLALLLIQLVTVVVAAIVRLALRRFLRSINFDELVARWGFSELAELAPSRKPSLLITRIVSWSIIAIGILIGISALDAALPSLLVVRIFSYIPNVIAALVVLAAGTFAARFLARSVLVSAVNMRIHSARLLSLGVKWMLLVLAAAMALQHLGIGGSIVTLSFAILFGGIVFALALAVGLGSKDMVSRSWEEQRRNEKQEEAEHIEHL